MSKGTETFGLHAFDLGIDVFHGEGDVVDAFSPLLQEFMDPAGFGQRVKQLHFSGTHLEERYREILAFHCLRMERPFPEHSREQGFRSLEILDGDADMVDLLHGVKLAIVNSE